jgi:general secretion pathway protein H
MRPCRGFTLVEILVVIAIIALAGGLVTMALRDPAASKLEQEAARLSALLESARAEARASGLAVQWMPARAQEGQEEAEHDKGFRFVGLPSKLALPQHWLEPEVRAEVVGARAVVLGPEPFIGEQRIVLYLADRRLTLATDGLGPFGLAGESAPGTPRP